MQPYWLHVDHDPDSTCARRAPPEVEESGGHGRDVALGLSIGRDPPNGRTADHPGVARAGGEAEAGGWGVDGGDRPVDPRAARRPLIVLDSSAVLALLLGKPAARGLHLRAARRG